MTDPILPLYRNRKAHEIFGPATRDPHPGLRFERFPCLLSKQGKYYNIPSGQRLTWLDEFIQHTAGSLQRLARHHARMDALLRATSGQARTFTTVGRLAIGLGNPNAGDIGFSLDHATGLPVLHGSSVKGLVAAGAQLLGEDRRALELLGEGPAPDGTSPGAGGALAFLDAHPAKWPPAGSETGFEIDIITRHHDAGSLHRQKLPVDADEPNPVHFLTVGNDVPFVFRVVPLSRAADIESAWRWLVAALANLGAGGKTAVGYGEMKLAEQTDEDEPPQDLARAVSVPPTAS